MPDLGAAAKPCPICGKPTPERFRPFCSRRCADIDLGRWLGGDYAVPVVETDEDDESALEDASRPDDAGGDEDDGATGLRVQVAPDRGGEVARPRGAAGGRGDVGHPRER